MKRKFRIGGYFLPIDSDTIEFESANALKSSLLMMFYVLFGITVFTDIVSMLKGSKSLFYHLLFGEERLQYSIFLLPFVLPIISLFLPKIRVTLDRQQGVVHFTQGKRAFDFPWNQINFNHQWFPTKTGGATLFTLISLPPYPDELNRLIEKKVRPAPGQAFIFKLGSFDVKSPEHGQAVFAFLDAWMRSREPAEALYESMVGSRFG